MQPFKPMLDYCANLEANNNRTWFHEHHGEYERALKDFQNLLDLVRFSIADSAPGLAESILSMRPKDWMYRVPRDMRMHRDIPPYNPSLRAYISADRKSWKPIGYFLMLSPSGSCFGTGLWCPDSPTLGRVRDYLAAHSDAFLELAEKSGVAVTGDSLKRLPRGFEGYAGSPIEPYLKLKQWEMIVPIPSAVMGSFDDFDTFIREMVLRMEPFRKFMLDACSERHLSAEEAQTKQFRDFYGAW